MKKLFTVLAVLLVASVAFAGFSGSIKAQYTFNFDERQIGYAKPQVGKDGVAFDASFAWDSQTLTIGEADGVHMEVSAHAGFEGWYLQGDDHAADYDPIVADKGEWVYKFPGLVYGTGTTLPESPDEAEDVLVSSRVFDSEYFEAGVKLKVNTFKIVADNWSVDFLGSVGLDFAKSAIDSKKFNEYKVEENKQFYSMDNSLKSKQDLAVTVAGYKFGFGLGASEDWTNELAFALTGVTPEYDFNGVKAQFGAGYQVTDKVYTFAASAKASYATDKLAVSGAYDAKITEKSSSDTDLYLLNDLAVKFDFAPVSVDVYFANDGAEAKDKYYDYMVTNQADHKVKLADDASNYLSAKVVVDVAKVAENVPVTVTLTGKNLINEKKQNVSVEAETTIVPNFKFGVYFKDMFDFASDHRLLGATVAFTGIEKVTLRGEASYAIADEEEHKMLTVAAGADYAHELFTASADVALEKVYGQDSVLGAIVGAKSATLVKGAELSAKAYFNLNKLAYLDTDDDNKLVLACKVSF